MTKQPDHAKHPNTKALIERAIEICGLTQKQIAHVCEVQQSVVSGWKSGKIAARWKQVRPLIDEYGDVQGEKSGHTYCRITNSSYVLAEEAIIYLRHIMMGTYLHETSLAANSAEKCLVKEVMDIRYSSLKSIVETVESQGSIYFDTVDEVYDFLRGFKGDFPDGGYFDWVITKNMQSELLKVSHRCDKEYVKVFGDPIFEYIFYESSDKYEDKKPWMKWSVISSTDGMLNWIVSKKAHGKGLSEVDQNHEPATWISEIYEDLDAEEVINKARNYRIDPKYETFVNEEILLFSLIQTLSQNGYDLECVKTIGNK